MRILILGFIVLVCMHLFIPGSVFSWFSIEEFDAEYQLGKVNADQDFISKAYGLSLNPEHKNVKSYIKRENQIGSYVPVDRINIDIPINLLSREIVDSRMSLDRQISANLRFRNALEEYLLLEKRTRKVLEGLSIPYLEKNRKLFVEKPKNNLFRERLEKRIENIENYGFAFNKPDRKQNQDQKEGSELADQMEKHPATINSEMNHQGLSQSKELGKYMKKNSERVDNPEFPWIFRVIFSMLNFIVTHKTDIILWAIAVIVSILITTLVFKK